ncbi:DUF885 family protein [Hymenobacter sp. HMF4947]|uniref:DUF885 family protein n=1 Tax=Hymenobacter ginkgonis TaxID=2682976 RepID=A0A7K1TJN6_9BACT|nr:DUF885 domain-containing protein [Hymenobacter ginkgonis]MVN78617.1 DUF885 family protein [Hymenobacter ginkgonis]
MKHFLLAGCLAAAWAVPAAAQPTRANAPRAAAAASSPLAALFINYWEEQARLFPLQATAQGDNRYNDQLPNDQTQAFRQQLQTMYQRYQTQLRKIDRTKLNANDQTSFDIFDYDLAMSLAELQQPHWMMPFNQVSGLPSSLGQLGAGTGAQPFKTTQDYRNWLGRAHAFPVWADSAISNFRRGMKAGIVLPKALVVKMIPQLQSFVVTNPTANLFYGPVAKFPAGVPAAEQPQLVAAYRQAIQQDLVPSYQKLAQFLETEYLPQARASSGIGAVPGGAAMYVYRVKRATTTDKTPAEIYQTGLSEVQRIRTAMEQVKQQVGFQGDLDAFFVYMRIDPKFRPFKTPEEVLAVYRGVLTRISPNLPKLFGKTPKAGFEVREVDKFLEASASASYSRAAPDGSRPGIFNVPIPDATQYNVTRGMDALFLHEAIPGHHYQIALQQENTSLPKFRQLGGYSAYTEGWGLYAESLGKELGVYTDPYQQIGALNTEIHRAIRLVVDVGLHTGKLTREEAIQYMMANEPIDTQRATAEIERYMAWPGQALAYKTGQLKIQELRTKYEKQLGSKFDLRAFHDQLLAGGAMPLAVLEKTMDAWAARQK